MNNEQLKKEMIRDEGYRKKLYTDSVGKLTIGIGHNIDDLGLSDRGIDMIYQEDLETAHSNLHRLYPQWQSLPEGRQHVLLNMSFNLGYRRFKGFKRFWKAVKADDTDGAIREMKDSRWYSQVGIRADRLSKMWRKS